MTELTAAEKLEIMRRRGFISDGDKKKHPAKILEIHHKDRNPNNNDPKNLRLLTRQEHQNLHKRAKR
jgi:hypothetical protein